MDDIEVKLRCVEAAARNPTPHPGGFTAGVLEAAGQWFMWIKSTSTSLTPVKGTLGLPKK